MATRSVAAIDLGAASGRVMLARFSGARLALEEVHRFINRPVVVHGHRFWNLFSLWEEVLVGLRKARRLAGGLDSVGVDAWAVDYGLVDRRGLLQGMPFEYRDRRTTGVMQQVWTRISRETLYLRTGIQLLPINTLFQLYAHEDIQPGELARAYRLLLIPDLLHNWLCGSLVSERTNVSTTQCWDPVAGRWATDLLAALGLPTSMLPEVVEAGTPLGPLLPAWREGPGIVQVIAPATHDTGSAIAAAPVSSESGWGYISSGTWSLVGIERARPVITPQALAANCTNEGGVFGTTRFLKNVMGLWLLQECQRQWTRDGRPFDDETLLAGVDGVPAFAALVDPDDPRFLAPAHMPQALNTFLQEQGQAPLQTPAAFARCIMESLVLRYREVFASIAQLAGTALTSVHVLGGGARNVRLNQWLADALGVPVLAGPFEATAYGNALMQLVGLGELGTLADVRAVARLTVPRVFEPASGRQLAWEEAAQRWRARGLAGG
ncbi:MAG TPA: rhamnulokinase family protein [Ktedonobacteraceae bacterium]|jgi:rhamnulokinase